MVEDDSDAHGDRVSAFSDARWEVNPAIEPRPYVLRGRNGKTAPLPISPTRTARLTIPRSFAFYFLADTRVGRPEQ
jgi:hypothetical protein